MAELDIAIKHVLAEYPRDWAEFVGVPRGLSVEAVDTDVSTISRVTDKVLHVHDDPPYILHLEPQGWYDPVLDERMHVYNGLLRQRHRLFVHSTAIALAQQTWGTANTGRVFGESKLGQCRLEFEYQVVKVWELPADLILSQGAGVLPLAPIADVEENRVADVVRQIDIRFHDELPRTAAAELWTATYVLLGLKYDMSFAAQLLQGVHDIMKESVTYQGILAEGVERGKAEGKAEGKRDDLILLGTTRFGEPTEAVRAKINGITDLRVLDIMISRILDAKDWNDLLAS